MPKVDLEFIVHRLNVDPLFPPKKQNLKRSTKEHVKAIRQKVKGSQGNKGGFFPEWLTNTTMVKKKNGKWKVCVDFTDLK